MGRKTDALLGRNFFRTSKVKKTVILAISRLAILKNQHQARCSYATSDALDLLNLGFKDRALLRVEQVIKERNMLEVFVMIENYCNLLLEKLELFRKNRECPEELKEAITSLIFASSRCGEFPELVRTREVLTSTFGGERLAVPAVELHYESGVNPKMIQKLSMRKMSSGDKLKVLQEIASDNGIILQEDTCSPIVVQETLASDRKQDHQKPKPEDKTHKLQVENTKEEEHIYKDDACQEVLESSAFSEVAAIELSNLSESQEKEKHDEIESSDQQERIVVDSDLSQTHEHASEEGETSSESQTNGKDNQQGTVADCSVLKEVILTSYDGKTSSSETEKTIKD